jgi:hypothetical protein
LEALPASSSTSAVRYSAGQGIVVDTAIWVAGRHGLGNCEPCDTHPGWLLCTQLLWHPHGRWL